jgi:DNA polymerase III epsilon subunit-like protein
MLLFIDTETTGKWDFKHSWDHLTQPNLLQLGMMLCLNDDDCTQISSLNEIIRPEPDWAWSDEAEAIHRISRDRAHALGRPLEEIINRAINLMSDADEQGMGGRVIAHNIQFDTNILLRAMALCGRNPSHYSMLHPFCTMRALTNRMNLPGKWPGKAKWPTLGEAFAYVCPDAVTDPEHRHSAMGDLLICREIFIEGRRKGWWS